MPRFVIDLGDIEMSKEDQASLNGALQSVALGHLAKLDFRQPAALHFPHEWLGLIMRRDFEGLKLADQVINERLAEMPVAGSR